MSSGVLKPFFMSALYCSSLADSASTSFFLSRISPFALVISAG